MTLKKQLALGFVLSSVAVIAVRAYLVLTKINPRTGFYENAGYWPLLFVLLLTGVNLSITWRWLNTQRGSPKLPFKGSIPLGGAAILLGLAVEFSTIEGILGILQDSAAGFPPNLFAILAAVFGNLACLAFVLQGVSFLRQNSRAQSVYLLTAPVVWQLCTVINRFSTYTDLRTVSEEQLFISFGLCSLLFLTGQVGFITGVEPRLLDRMVVFGAVTGMLGLAIALPRLVALIWIPGYGVLRLSDVLVTLFAGCYGILFAWESALEGKKKTMWPSI